MLWQTLKRRICETILGVCRVCLERETAAGPCSGFWKVLGTACHQVCPARSVRLVLSLLRRTVQRGTAAAGFGKWLGQALQDLCCSLLGCFSSCFISGWNELGSGVIFCLH